jgi:hypothetical protein
LIFIDIIFQKGDFYNSDSEWWLDLLNAVVGAAIGSGVTVWALYQTFKRDKQKEESRRIQFQKEKIQYLQSLLRSINKSIELQIDAFKAASDALKESPLDPPKLSYVPFNDLSRVTGKINLEEYYHSYLAELGNSQESTDEFRKIVSFLDYFDNLIVLVKLSYEKACNYDYKAKVDLKELTEKSMDYVANAIIDPEVAAQADFFAFLNQTLIDFHAKREEAEIGDLKFYNDNFIQVLKAGLIEFAKTIPVAQYLLIQMKNATHMFEDIQSQNLYVADDFESWHTESKKNYGLYLKIANRLINHKT